MWESRWFRSSGFYTNRLRLEELVERCRSAGLDAIIEEQLDWDHLPLGRDRMARPFSQMSSKSLVVRAADVQLRRTQIVA